MDYIHPSLLEDQSFVETILDSYGREVVFSMVKRNWKVFCALPNTMRSDRDILAQAVKQDWHAMEFAIDDEDNGHEWWADRAMVLLAVQQNWEAALHMKKDMWSELMIVKAAMLQNASIIDSAPTRNQRELWNDRDIVKNEV